MVYDVKGFYNRGGWPCQVEIFTGNSLQEAVEFCKGYTKNSFGGYEYFILCNSDEVIEGYFNESGFIANEEKESK